MGLEVRIRGSGPVYFGFAPLRTGWLTSPDSLGAIVQRHNLDGTLADPVVEAIDIVDVTPDGRSVLLSDPYRSGVVGRKGQIQGFGGEAIGFLGDQVLVTRKDGRVPYIGKPGGPFTEIRPHRGVTATASACEVAIAAHPRDGREGVYTLPEARPVMLIGRAEGRILLSDSAPRQVPGRKPNTTPRNPVRCRGRHGRVLMTTPGITMADEAAVMWGKEGQFLFVPAVDHPRRGAVDAPYILRADVDGTLERVAGPATSPHGFVLPTR